MKAVRSLFWTTIVQVILAPSYLWAASEAPQTVTLDGTLYSSATSSTPLLDSSVVLKVQILDLNRTCILYEETQTVNTSSSDGHFTIEVGSPTSGAASAKRTTVDVGNAMALVFQNTSSVSGKLISNGAACTYNPSVGDSRYFRVFVTPSSTGATAALSPDLLLSSVPSALVAETLNGVTSANILQADATTSLSQANLATVFSNTNYPKLTSLLGGGSSQYVNSGSGTGASLPTYSTASPPSTPAAGRASGMTARLKR